MTDLVRVYGPDGSGVRLTAEEAAVFVAANPTYHIEGDAKVTEPEPEPTPEEPTEPAPEEPAEGESKRKR